MLLNTLFTNHIFELLLIIISAYILSKTGKTRDTGRGRRAFHGFAVANLVFQLSNLGMNLYREEEIGAGLRFGYFVYILAILTMAAGAFFWFCYVDAETGAKLLDTGRKQALWAAPLLVLAVLCAVSLKTGWLFFFDSRGKYDIGPLFFLQYVFIYGYVLLAMILSGLNYFRAERKNDTDRMLLTLMVVDTVAAVIQLVYPVFAIDAAFVLTLILGYINVYTEEAYSAREQKENISENYSRFFALEDDFMSLYDVELESGHYVSFDKDEFYSSNISDRLVSQDEFFESLRPNIDRVVYEADRETAYSFQQKDNIVKGLSESDHIDNYYRIITDEGLMWLKMRIVYKNADRKNIIIGVFDADEEMEAKQRDELAREELFQTNSRLFALEDNFESLYDLELESGRYESFVKGDFYQKTVNDKLVEPGDYFEDLRGNIDAVIYEEDRDGLCDALSRESIRRVLDAGDRFDYYYRINTPDGPMWLKMRIVYKDAEKKNVIIGVFNAAEEMAAREKEERHRQELLSRMAGDDGVLLVDCVHDAKQIIHDYTHADEEFYETPSYTGTLSQYIDKFVAESDRDMMRRETSPRRMLARVKDEQEYTVRYRETHGGEPRFFEMRVSAFSDTEVLQSYKNIDEQVRYERAQKAISEDFFAIYIADLDNDVIRVVKRSPVFRGDSALTENSYSKIIGEFISGLREPDRLKWQGLDTAGGVRAFLAGQDKRELLYESSYRKGGLSRATWFVTERVGGEAASVCLAFSNLDEDEADREKLNERIAVQKEQLQESLTFTDYFLDTYVSAYYVNLETRSYQIYKRTDELEKNYPVISDYFVSLTEYINTDVHPEDREKLLAIVRPESMKELLRERPEYSFIFRDISGGTKKYYRMQVIRGADGQHAAFGFIDITEEVSAQRSRQLEAEESRKLIDSIASSYNAAYAVSMSTDTFRILRMDDSIIGADRTFDTFTEAREFFIGLLPESDRDGMRHELDYDTVREKLKDARSYDVEYRIPISGAMTWHILNVTAIDIANDYIAVGFAKRDLEITQKHLEDKRYGEYFALYEIDIDSGMMKIVKDSPYYGLDRSGTAMPFAPAMMRFASGLDDEPREFFERFADLDYAKERFAREDKLTYTYRSSNVNENDWVECTCYVTLRHADGTPAMFTFGFSLIDSLGVYRQELQEKYIEQNEMLISQQEQLEEARNAAEKANAAKTDFLFSMSHDIRTPMNAIMGFTNMAIKHIDEKEKAIDCLEKTQKAGTMLLSLINSVLEVSRIESGHATLEEQPGNIYFSFSNIENTMREMADTKDIRLFFEFGDIQDKYVYADFSRCMRVFVNVISNSIKYTPEGGIVKVRCEQTGKAENGYGTYRYTVTDNGIGMSEEFQKHIFEQFSREQTSTVSGIQGSGLGMSVVKSFVELMGGTVAVKSTLGEGSEITVTLPLRLQEGESYTDPATGEIVTAAMKTEKPETVSFAGRRALLVEDNELNREIAIEILEDEKLNVDDADDGTKAVEILKEKGPDYYDFILMDIQMPVMNGYEATKAIRAMYPDRHIPIIALSANAFAEDRKKSLEAGMDDHVAKPINIKDLLATLAKFL